MSRRKKETDAATPVCLRRMAVAALADGRVLHTPGTPGASGVLPVVRLYVPDDAFCNFRLQE